MKEDIIALYIRLSLEDSKYDSMSIENQQMILREKAVSLSGIDHAEIREFVDKQVFKFFVNVFKVFHYSDFLLYKSITFVMS